jgi:DNA-binding MarR family transcriptional regulator
MSYSYILAAMDAHTLNLLGALSVGCADLQQFAMAEIHLPPADLAALLAVHTRPGSTVGDVSLTTGLTHSGAVRVLDRLGEAGWTERKTGRDRRTVAIYCTPEGRRKAKLALSLRQTALRNLTTGLGKRDLAAFRTLAKKLLSRLPHSRPDAWRVCRLCDHGVCSGADCPVGTAVP